MADVGVVPDVVDMVDGVSVELTDQLLRETGMVPPPTLHMLSRLLAEPYIGKVSTRPFYRGLDAEVAVTGLGLLPSLLLAALHAESSTLGAAAAYQVACAFLKNDRLNDAETVALVTAANLDDDDSPAGLSVRGALTLIAAVVAGRRNDRGEAAERLQRAQLLAEQLGEDANHAWTAFGPTNVAIHRVSAAAEMGDAAAAIAQAEFVDVASMPEGLLSRRAQVHIDMAWAYTQRRADAEAVVNLLEAERVAPQTLRYNILVRKLLREMLKRERRTATPGLRSLAQRAGVLAS